MKLFVLFLSLVAAGSLFAAQPVSAPTGLTASVSGDSQVRLGWNNHGCSAPVIQVSSDGNLFADYAMEPPAIGVITIGPFAGKVYFRVVAAYGTSRSAPSSVVAVTITPSPTPSPAQTPTPPPTPTPSPTPTDTPTPSPSPSPVPSATPTPSTPTPTPTLTPSATPSPSPTPSLTPTPTPIATVTPTPTPSVTATPTPSPSSSPSPTVAPAHVTASWSPTPGHSYRIFWGALPDGSDAQSADAGQSSSYIIQGLMPGQPAYVSGTARNAAGESAKASATPYPYTP